MNLKYSSRPASSNAFNKERIKEKEVNKIAKLVAEDVKKILSSASEVPKTTRNKRGM